MDGQGTTCRRNIAENFNHLSTVHERYRRIVILFFALYKYSYLLTYLLTYDRRHTDRQTDRQTDGRQQIANVNVTFTFAEMAKTHKKQTNTRMWARAERDGRPAEHRWRLLFNAAKFGSRPVLDAVQ